VGNASRGLFSANQEGGLKTRRHKKWSREEVVVEKGGVERRWRISSSLFLIESGIKICSDRIRWKEGYCLRRISIGRRESVERIQKGRPESFSLRGVKRQDGDSVRKV